MKSYYQDYNEDYDCDEFLESEAFPEDQDGFYYDSDGYIFPVEKKAETSVKSKSIVKPEVVYVVNNNPAPWAKVKNEPVNFRKILEENQKKEEKCEINVPKVLQEPEKPVRLLWNNKNIKIETIENEVKSCDKILEYNNSKKTKFCLNMIDSGKCSRKSCLFAHNLKELNFPDCRFSDKCKKKNCMYKHPCETIEEFKKRIDFKIPNNIK